MTPSDLIRTAEILKREAKRLRDLCTMFDEPWPHTAQCEKYDHDEMLSLAAKLREEAGKR